MAGWIPMAGHADEAPFDVRSWEVRGRALHAFAARFGLASPRLAVLSVSGSPADEERWLTVFPAFEAARLGEAAAARPWVVAVPRDVVAVDVADLLPEPGPEIVFVASRELRIHTAQGEAQRIALPSHLPLPPRSHAISRLRLVRDWTGNGRPTALLPSLDGALLVELPGEGPLPDVAAPPSAAAPSGTATAGTAGLRLPLVADYRTLDEGAPVYPGYAEARLVWPSLTRADDDGDGRADLFALSPSDVWVFHAGEAGLPAEPSRAVALPDPAPYAADRAQTARLRAFARDVDGDGRADLVLHRSEGNLMTSRSETSVFLNGGDGADPSAPADAGLRTRGGFGALALEDLDGDGQVELVQSVVRFGLAQLIRALVTRRVEARLEVHTLDHENVSSPGLRRTFRTNLGYGVDLDEGRVLGLLPTVEGDWNGDGVRDLLHGEGRDRVRIRLGRVSGGGPGFDGGSAGQRLPAADQSAIADWDGDGLDDLAVWDRLDEDGAVHVCLNRGVLPGSPPRASASMAPRKTERGSWFSWPRSDPPANSLR